MKGSPADFNKTSKKYNGQQIKSENKSVTTTSYNINQFTILYYVNDEKKNTDQNEQTV